MVKVICVYGENSFARQLELKRDVYQSWTIDELKRTAVREMVSWMQEKYSMQVEPSGFDLASIDILDGSTVWNAQDDNTGLKDAFDFGTTLTVHLWNDNNTFQPLAASLQKQTARANAAELMLDEAQRKKPKQTSGRTSAASQRPVVVSGSSGGQDAINTRLEDMARMITSLLEQIDSQNKKIDSQNKKIDSQNKRLDALSNDVSNLRARVIALEEDVTDLQEVALDSGKMNQLRWRLFHDCARKKLQAEFTTTPGQERVEWYKFAKAHPLNKVVSDLTAIGSKWSTMSSSALSLLYDKHRYTTMRSMGSVVAHEATQSKLAEAILSIPDGKDREDCMVLFKALFGEDADFSPVRT